mmetsp:Transcript_37470/g.120644  ORF Transcript_37470/g.120644 Transcript_37470/m.120644 type:complete len:214 (-) Transcript_37470:57-698(-)
MQFGRPLRVNPKLRQDPTTGPAGGSAATACRPPPPPDERSPTSRAGAQPARSSRSSTSWSRSTCAGCAAARQGTRIPIRSHSWMRCQRASPGSQASRPRPRSSSARSAAPMPPTPKATCFATSRGAACPSARAAWCVPCGRIRSSRRCHTSPWRSTGKACCKAQDVRHCPGYSLTWARPKHPGNLPMTLPNSSPHAQNLPQRHRPPKRQPSLA